MPSTVQKRIPWMKWFLSWARMPEWKPWAKEVTQMMRYLINKKKLALEILSSRNIYLIYPLTTPNRRWALKIIIHWVGLSTLLQIFNPITHEICNESRLIRFLCTWQARIYSKSEVDSERVSKTGLKITYKDCEDDARKVDDSSGDYDGGMLVILMIMVMVFITMIFQLYTELPSGNLSPGSEICGCQEGGQLKCTTLEEVIIMLIMLVFLVVVLIVLIMLIMALSFDRGLLRWSAGEGKKMIMKSFSRWQASRVTQNKAITGDGAAWFCCHRHQHLQWSHSHHYLIFPIQVFQPPYFWPLLIILKINLCHRKQYHQHNLS